MTDKIPILTIGDIRKALEGLPDEQMVMNQLIGKNGGAWYLELYFTPKLPRRNASVFTSEHRDLVNLPMVDVVTIDENAITIWERDTNNSEL